jgi:hypothetical protein
MPGKYDALVLARGEWFQPPPIRPRVVGADSWPTDATVETIFYDSLGGVINTIAGVVTADGLIWDVSPDEVDVIPAGANYETFLTTIDDKRHQIKYGQVIRKQASFFGARAAQQSTMVQLFSDNFYNRKGLVGSKWVPLLGRPTIFDNADPEPNGVGPNTVFFVDMAMRYYVPLNADSWILSFNLVNPGPGSTGIFGAANSAGTSYVYAMFESNGALGGSDKVHMGIGSGPIAMTDQVSTVDYEVPGGGTVSNYKLRYDDDTKMLELFVGNSTTALIDWEDSGHVAPHGDGYRYFGCNAQSSLLSSGPQLTSIKAQDGLDA